MNGVLFLSARHVSVAFSWESQLLRPGEAGVRGREGDRKKACHLGAVCPSPLPGNRRLSVTQPRAGHRVAFVSGSGSHLGLSPYNWCQGKSNGPAGVPAGQS